MKYFILLLLPAVLLAQVPNILWQKRMGSTDGEIARSMIKTTDGGFILGGYSTSNAYYEKTDNCRGGADYWIVKTNATGEIQWDKTIGGALNDVLYSIIQTSDGYLISGSSGSDISGEKNENCRGGYDYWILKLSLSGTIEWQKTIGGNALEDYANVISTLDGGFLVYGDSRSDISGEKTEMCRGIDDIWLVKLSLNGLIEWQKTIGGDGFDRPRRVIQNSDGSYIIAAESTSNISGEKTENSRGYYDLWILKTDSLGNILQQRTIGGADYDWVTSLIPTTDGNYMITAVSRSGISGEKTEGCRGDDDYWILKLDPLFNIIFQRTYGGDHDEYLTNLVACANGGYLVFGSSQSGISGEKLTPVSGYNDAWILKLNDSGTIVWQKTIGGYAPGIYSGQDGFTNAVQLQDDSFVLFGTTDSNISGDIVDFPRGIFDYWLVKLDAENLNVPENSFSNEFILSPNPASHYITIQSKKNLVQKFNYQIIDSAGKVISAGNSNSSEKINIDYLQSGNYLIKLNKDITLKFIKK